MGHSDKVNAGTYQRPQPLTVLAITKLGAVLASSDASKPKTCKLSGKGDTVIYEAATQHPVESTSIPAEKILRLIELVQSEECTWDMRSDVYHDRNKKRSVVQTIAESLELQGKISFLPNQQILLPAVSTSECQLQYCCIRQCLWITYFCSQLVV